MDEKTKQEKRKKKEINQLFLGSNLNIRLCRTAEPLLFLAFNRQNSEFETEKFRWNPLNITSITKKCCNLF